MRWIKSAVVLYKRDRVKVASHIYKRVSTAAQENMKIIYQRACGKVALHISEISQQLIPPKSHIFKLEK